MFPLPLSIWFEIAALTISLVCYNSLKNKPLRWFVLFLFLVVVTELYGRHLRNELHEPNTWLYNIFIPIEFLFYGFIFTVQYLSRKFQKLAGILMTVFGFLVIVTFLLLKNMLVLNTKVLIAGNILMIFCSCLYFVDLLNQDIVFNLHKLPMFWISTGLLIFNAGELSYNLFFDYILSHKQDFNAIVFTAINGKLIFILYGFISIGLLCTKISPNKNYLVK